MQNPDPLKCAGEWATETAGLACTFAYSDVDGSHIQDGFTLGEAYYQVRARARRLCGTRIPHVLRCHVLWVLHAVD
jgi:hypothetical protein